jgi:hypothetical protein
MTILTNLAAAGKYYSSAANSVAGKVAVPRQPIASESELLIALGIASDWVRRAGAMRPISFDSKRMRKSAKTPSVSQLVRFNLAWAGMNALFSRNSVFTLLGIAHPISELDRFKALYAKAAPSYVDMTAHLGTLHALLQKPTVSYVPGFPAGSTHTVLKALHFKYTPMQYQNMATGKKVAAAIGSGNLAALDIPTLMYLMRNWSVHGGIVSSNFRSVSGFDRYISTMNEALALVHLNLSHQMAAHA